MKAYSLLILSAFALILVFLGITAFQMRPAADDFAYLADVKDMGIWQTALFSFESWNTRFTSILYAAFGFALFEMIGSFAFELILIWIIFIIGIYKILVFIFIDNLSKLSIWVMTASSFLAFFFVTPSIPEVWAWHISYSMYFIPLVASIWLCYILFKPKYRLSDLFLAGIAILYLSMASEFWNMLWIMAALMLLTIHKLSSHQKALWGSILSIFILGLLMMHLGEGRGIRAGQLPETDLIKAISIAARSLTATLIKYILPRIPILLCLSIPFLIAGMRSQPQERGSILPFAGIAIGFWLCLVLINHYGLAYTMQESGPLRARSISAFLFIPLLSYISFLAGKLISTHRERIEKLSFVPAGLILALCLYLFIYFIPKQQVYANAYDARIHLLKELNRSEGITEVKLRPLPHSGMIYSNDIQIDTLDYRNKGLKRYLDLNFPVLLKEKPIGQPF